ncbi:holo-ACP synthase [Clostridium perfringens]|uniref:Holo-[acyl-carrier-protein] synthase n=1 Tax=Clostridium perfringens (strain 13 / Type A) TaxID=195102 RepID=ACPS_CLOPE|nr:holo-ACP synthase [Clostridium perfringens]Q8XNP1.1 RecName: Full=Holo-[acyl-carrier-protein] synthase; Short=Holo-ACP synthase; AltName: Full=4'-phosphopantetheinyl transferase AcpS [Clostridium perfringens str. 13]EJT6165407.1 holo-ACP synthase [Clostridium perfringens]EJT6501353.1 holo-ACP synthase [Clostridium perfringens]EJT6656873.1 holo-ACP synthase [Clostridium perfringens]EJT6665246.1 holo-ACP synthase [Clostridium perfringens]ELC8348081.1 holo-ACP synthase [Clostridium perfringen
MIIGIGVDIIEIERVRQAIQNNKNFLSKLFTERELDYFISRNMNSEVIAGNFAAKEAVSKALGTGIRGFSFKDIEILRNELGKPEVILHNGANLIGNKLVGNNNSLRVHLSISHNNSSAIAYSVLEGEYYGNM